MDKRILIPTDFSKNALNAIRYALDLYKNKNCEFYFLNTFHSDVFSLDNKMMVPEPGEPSYEAAKKKSADGLKKLLTIVGLHVVNPKHQFHTISTFNSLIEAIREVIGKKDIELVIMGTKGATASRSVVFGTNTVQVMEKISECPVLAVPDDFLFGPPREIVFPTDYKTVYKRREMVHLLELAQMYKTPIRVLHIEEEEHLTFAQENNKELLEAILAGTEYSEHVLTGTKVKEGIYSFIESRGSDMIAFINKRHRFFGMLFSHPLVKEIGNDSQIPVLVLNDKS
ncbi:universal stress protein [Arenibacter sp. 6A1]|uniref:universal stress protein n=1 Tax=Arenibacter sp. 6A1 TaxID=2720391 RepID=UPI001446FAAA|nr:universal stress protein [Arenibacter sp. 6A1]NKI25746.1 universal stress protein [Arenibacter sp. 6A1]